MVIEIMSFWRSKAEKTNSNSTIKYHLNIKASDSRTKMRVISSIFFLVFVESSFAFSLDCGGKVFHSLEWEQDSVLVEPFGLGNKTTKITWLENSIEVIEDTFDVQGVRYTWLIERNDFSFRKTTVSMRKAKRNNEIGQCELVKAGN